MSTSNLCLPQVTWKAKKSDLTNGGYSEQLLEGLFSRYGPLHHVLVSTKRKGKALISFHSAADAVSSPSLSTLLLAHLPFPSISSFSTLTLTLTRSSSFSSSSSSSTHLASSSGEGDRDASLPPDH